MGLSTLTTGDDIIVNMLKSFSAYEKEAIIDIIKRLRGVNNER